MNNIDQIFVINLKRRPDRLASFYKDLKYIPLNRDSVIVFEAIDGSELNMEDEYIRKFIQRQ